MLFYLVGLILYSLVMLQFIYLLIDHYEKADNLSKINTIIDTFIFELNYTYRLNCESID